MVVGILIPFDHLSEDILDELGEKVLDKTGYSFDKVEMDEETYSLICKRGNERKKHKCVFSFEEEYVGKEGLYEPKKGETGFSIKRDDWICRCGKTRRDAICVEDEQ